MENTNDFQQNDMFDVSQALKEGWTVEYDNCQGARIRGIAYSDLQAWWHVAKEVERGSEYHQLALLELSDKERFALELNCGPISTPNI
ncbi:hypothetical protein JK202_16090 [Gluconobacter sp. Dm-62]|uniref:hypothetical protein n=1 Tax=Gluconobacter sp. Dm-62 TaxID=2799804 RepID=UPI001B8B6B53|nr:hypothetical protein [Gluconobacter sp. Dm-62]MBS1104482.1 hypothetical protein [Gluconobacter sp. Dm-62]